MSLFNDSGSYTWVITKKLSSCKVGEKLTSEVFPIAVENLQCQMKIYPNGSKEDFEGYAMVFCKIVSMPANWKIITICKTVDSPQTKSKQTNMGQYKIGINQGWKYVLPFNEIRDLSKLELVIRIKILRVEMRNTHIIYPNDNFEYEKQTELKYSLTSDQIQSLKHCKMGKMVESNIMGNDMWCIRLCPNGCTPRDAGKCAIGLTLCGLPKDVSKIKVRWSIQCESMNIHSTQTSDFSVDGTTKGCNIGTFKQFKQLNELRINILVQIMKEYDNNNKKVPVKFTESKRALFNTESKLELLAKLESDSIGSHDSNHTHSNHTHKLEAYEFKMNILQQKLIKYDGIIENMNTTMDKMNNKISKIAELLSKSLKLTKQNDIEIKKLNNKLNKILDEEEKKIDNRISNTSLKDELNQLKREVTQLKIKNKNSNGNNSEDEPLTPQELLKKFLEKEAKINDDTIYESFVENGFESIESLFDLTMDDLKEIGINKLYHRKQLLKCIQKEKYKNRQSFSHSHPMSHHLHANKPALTPGHTVEGSVSYQSYIQ